MPSNYDKEIERKRSVSGLRNKSSYPIIEHNFNKANKSSLNFKRKSTIHVEGHGFRATSNDAFRFDLDADCKSGRSRSKPPRDQIELGDLFHKRAFPPKLTAPTETVVPTFGPMTH